MDGNLEPHTVLHSNKCRGRDISFNLDAFPLERARVSAAVSVHPIRCFRIHNFNYICCSNLVDVATNHTFQVWEGGYRSMDQCLKIWTDFTSQIILAWGRWEQRKSFQT